MFCVIYKKLNKYPVAFTMLMPYSVFISYVMSYGYENDENKCSRNRSMLDDENQF